MRIKISSYLIGLSVVAALFANAALGFADNQLQSFSISTDDFELVEDFEEVAVEAIARPVPDDSENLKEQEMFLNRLKQELDLSKLDYHQLLNNIADTKDRLDLVSEEKITLRIQVHNLDALIASTTERLLGVIQQVVEIENELSLLYEQIELREVAVEYQKDLLRDYIKVMYQEENSYFSMDDSGELNTFKLLLADGSVSETLKKLEYLDLLSVTGQQLLDKLGTLHKELIVQKTQFEYKKAKLDSLRLDTVTEKKRLEDQKDAKENLLVLTTGQEEIYSQLLEQTIEEQMSVVDDIKALSSAISFVEKDIALDADFDASFYDSILSDKNRAIYDFHLRYRGMNPDGFAWPVDPFKGISAFFRDPSYVGVFGVRHNAVDIPAYQGTPIRSAADGVVYTTKDNGYGYSYVIIAHSGGLSTVYGHVSKILVREGDTVSEGSIIALSGGMPGTKGAGYMTTGPHLHFEVHMDGDYVDPLEYLPLEVLNEDQILALPDKYLDPWEKAFYGDSYGLIQRF